MTEILARGLVKRLGDDINTDYIVPSHRKKETIDPQILRRFVFEDIDPGFYDRMSGATPKTGWPKAAESPIGCKVH